MPVADVNGLEVAYDLVGEGDEAWTITPGGRFSKDVPGIRQLAEELARAGKQVLIWDRPNTGESEVSFEGDSESAMQADTLAALLRHLDLAPAVITGGSGGSRVSLLTASRHPDVARGLAVWWISGGTYGLMSLGTHYCGDSILAAWTQGMEAVADLPEWQEVQQRNARNRPKILAQDRAAFIATFERWMQAYCPRPDEVVPGLANADAEALTIPTLVFRSGASDPHHTRDTTERVAALLPEARLVEPPWDDGEWNERRAAAARGEGLFSRWPLLAPQLLDWSAAV